MFKAIDLMVNAGPLKNAWERLIRQIQTEVEHKRVTNDTVTDMVKGEIVYMTAGNRQAALAIATAAASSRWAAVMAEPTAAGEQGISRTDGYALVKFEDNLDNVVGNEGLGVVLSETTAGTASMDWPVVAGSYTVRIGILADATEYDGVPASDTYNPYAWVVLGHRCFPSEGA
jgi:hypothetical protein